MATQPAVRAKKPFIVTGRLVLFVLLGFFGVIFVVNYVFVYYALHSFRGVVTESSYEAGRQYKSELDTAAAQAMRQWKVDVHSERTPTGVVEIDADFADKSGAPIGGLAVSASLVDPLSDRDDHTFTLNPAGGGHYRGETSNVAPGRWSMSILARKGNEQLFRSDNPLDFPRQ